MTAIFWAWGQNTLLNPGGQFHTASVMVVVLWLCKVNDNCCVLTFLKLLHLLGTVVGKDITHRCVLTYRTTHLCQNGWVHFRVTRHVCRHLVRECKSSVAPNFPVSGSAANWKPFRPLTRATDVVVLLLLFTTGKNSACSNQGCHFHKSSSVKPKSSFKWHASVREACEWS